MKALTVKELKTFHEVKHASLKIVNRYKKWAAIRRQRLEYEREEKLVTKDIRTFLGTADALLSPDGTQLLCTYRQSGGQVFNEAAFAKAHPALYSKFLEPSGYRTLRMRGE